MRKRGLTPQKMINDFKKKFNTKNFTVLVNNYIDSVAMAKV